MGSWRIRLKEWDSGWSLEAGPLFASCYVNSGDITRLAIVSGAAIGWIPRNHNRLLPIRVWRLEKARSDFERPANG